MPIGIRVPDLPAAAGILDDDDEFLTLEDGSLRRATRTQAGPKASIVQVTDTANQFTATTVEGVLTEIQDNVDALALPSFSVAPQHAFRQRLTAKAGPAVVNLLGDSTGTGPTEADDWFTPLFESLAAALPDWTAATRLWSDTIQGYGPAVYRQTPAGSYLQTAPVGGGGGAYIADSAGRSLTNCDALIVAKIRVDDSAAAPDQIIAAHFDDIGNWAWRFGLTSGVLYFDWTTDGTTLNTTDLTTAEEAAALLETGGPAYVGVKFDRNNGAGKVRVEAVTSVDGVTWTTFGTPDEATAAITTIYDSTGPVRVGSRGEGGLPGQPLGGRIYWVNAYKGLTTADTLAWSYTPEAAGWTTDAAATIVHEGLGYVTPVAGGMGTAPVAAAIPTGIDLRAHFRVRRVGAWAAGEFAVGGQYGVWAGGTPEDSAWYVYLTGADTMVFRMVNAAGVQTDYGATFPALPADEDLLLGFTFDGSTGIMLPYRSTDNGETWSLMGSGTSGATQTAFNDSPYNIQVGNRGAGDGVWAGRIYWMEVFDGLLTTDRVLWRFDASMHRPGSGSASFIDAEGRTWAATGTTTITDGAPLLLGMNGSHPGATITYAEDATRQPKLIAAPANLTIFNWGHNQTESDVQAVYQALVADVRTAWPSSGIVVNRQNPQGTTMTNHDRQNRHQANIGEMAARNGWGVIDGFRAFLDTGKPDSYLGDGVHPTAAGYVLWSNAARLSFGLDEV